MTYKLYKVSSSNADEYCYIYTNTDFKYPSSFLNQRITYYKQSKNNEKFFKDYFYIFFKNDIKMTFVNTFESIKAVKLFIYEQRKKDANCINDFTYFSDYDPKDDVKINIVKDKKKVDKKQYSKEFYQKNKEYYRNYYLKKKEKVNQKEKNI